MNGKSFFFRSVLGMYVAWAHIACAHFFRFPGVCCCSSEFLVGSASLRFPEVLGSLVSAATYCWEFPTVVLVPEAQLNPQLRSLARRLETASELHWWTKYWITSWCFNNAPKATSLPCYIQCGDFGWFCSWAGKGRLCSLTRPSSCCRWWQSILWFSLIARALTWCLITCFFCTFVT